MILNRNANQTFILFDWTVLMNAAERLPGLLNETREYCLQGMNIRVEKLLQLKTW